MSIWGLFKRKPKMTSLDTLMSRKFFREVTLEGMKKKLEGLSGTNADFILKRQVELLDDVNKDIDARLALLKQRAIELRQTWDRIP